MSTLDVSPLNRIFVGTRSSISSISCTHQFDDVHSTYDKILTGYARGKVTVGITQAVFLFNYILYVAQMVVVSMVLPLRSHFRSQTSERPIPEPVARSYFRCLKLRFRPNPHPAQSLETGRGSMSPPIREDDSVFLVASSSSRRERPGCPKIQSRRSRRGMPSGFRLERLIKPEIRPECPMTHSNAGLVISKWAVHSESIEIYIA